MKDNLENDEFDLVDPKLSSKDDLDAEERLIVDIDGFDTAMAEQRAKARAAWSGSGSVATDKVWFEIMDAVGPTEFLGYSAEVAEAEILALINAEGTPVETLKQGETGCIITNQTPFYGESGGQTGDTGMIKASGDVSLTVTDTQKKLSSLTVHHVTCDAGEVSKGDAIELRINVERRDAIRANHSATHLLHKALKRHLGDHVAQKGSLVTADRLRFDISQPKAATQEQLMAVEVEVNERIRQNTEVTTRLMPVDDARAAGATAMFGEKYDDEVRVLAMGGQDPDNAKLPYSMELCGGTHVRRTGDIGLIKVISESAVSSGVRRIEAVTGAGALAYLNTQSDQLKQAASALKSGVADVPVRVEALLVERKKMEKEISDLRRQVAAGGGGSADSASSEVKTINGTAYTSRVMEGMPPKELKPMADEMKEQLGSGVIALIAVNEGRASIVVAVTDDLTDKINAVDLVRVGAEKLGGKGGGGRPDMAQAGGPDGDSANDAVKAIAAAVAG